jgi:hypothetical protein
MEPESSPSQEPTTGPYPEPDGTWGSHGGDYDNVVPLGCEVKNVGEKRKTRAP